MPGQEDQGLWRSLKATKGSCLQVNILGREGQLIPEGGWIALLFLGQTPKVFIRCKSLFLSLTPSMVMVSSKPRDYMLSLSFTSKVTIGHIWYKLLGNDYFKDF